MRFWVCFCVMILLDVILFIFSLFFIIEMSTREWDTQHATLSVRCLLTFNQIYRKLTTKPWVLIPDNISLYSHIWCNIRARSVLMVTTKSSAPKPTWPGQVIGWWDILVLRPVCLYNQEAQLEASNTWMNKHSVTEHSAWWQWNISPPTTFLVNRCITDQPGCVV
mgnify:CR=1 FL=1